MTSIFYSLGIPAILYEISVIQDPYTLIGFDKRLDEKIKNKEELNKVESNFLFLQMGYLVWLIVGLFTFQWYLFLVILILSLLLKKDSIKLLRLDAIISLILLILITINKYHL